MEAKRYIRVNMVEAEPMTAYEFDDFKKREHSGENCEGYKVVYDDGYVSWCPKARFEEVSREIDRMNFGMAIEAMKKGHKVARKGWNGKGIYIELQRPDEHSKMTQPYIYIVTTGLQTDNPDAPKGIVPWLASQTDTMAEDWILV